MGGSSIRLPDNYEFTDPIDFAHDLVVGPREIEELGGQLQLSITVLALDKDQLVSQLYGRLAGLGAFYSSL